MITVPPEFLTERTTSLDAVTLAWLEELPDLVRSRCAEWGLGVPGGVRFGGSNLVVEVDRDGVPLVLKMCGPDHDALREATALRIWDGRGAVRLHAAAGSALLLERLDADRPLSALPLPVAAVAAGRLIRELAVQAPSGTALPLLSAEALRISAEIIERGTAGAPGIPAPPGELVHAVAGLARDLADRTSPGLLVHGDLHGRNVLRPIWTSHGTRGVDGGWRAIDPKPVIGDPEFAVPELLWTRLDECVDDQAIREMLATVAAAGDLDPDLARTWAQVRAVDYWQWGLASGLTQDPVRCARLLAALA